MANVTEIKVPNIGDFSEVPVIEIHVAPGDTVAEEDPLVTIESDKATTDIPSPLAGKIVELKVAVDDEVSEGDLLVTIEAGEAEAADEEDAPEPQPEVEEKAEPEPESSSTDRPIDSSTPDSDTSESGPAYASPAVRKLARERGIDLARVKGTGRKGRITKEDVEAWEAKRSAGGGSTLDIPPWPQVDFEKFGPVERIPLSRIKKISGPTLTRNWVMIPHVTHHEDADITDLEAFRKQVNSEQDVKVTMVALLVKAAIASLREFPQFNSSLEGDELVLKRHFHLGFAADTPNGLLVPVIKDADKKGLLDIAEELGTLAGKARDGKLSYDEMSGGTFTISSLGGIGGTGFTPIINAPEVAVLGVTRSAMRPVWNGSEFEPRLMVPLSLSYDHRVIDGADAARFMVHLSKVLGDFRRVLL